MTGITGLLTKENSHDEKFRSLCNSIKHRGHERIVSENSNFFDDSRLFSMSIMLGIEQKQRIVKHDHGFSLIDIWHVPDNEWKSMEISIERSGSKSFIDLMKQKSSINGFLAVTAAPEVISIYRSKDGTIPLYYALEENEFLFCSEKKGFYNLSIDNQIPLKPGEQLIVDSNGKVSLVDRKDMIVSETETSENQHHAKMKSILKDTFQQVEGLDKCGVLFSGGVDSSLIALLLKEKCRDVVLFTSSTLDSHDSRVALESAEILELPLVLTEITPEIVWEILPEVIFSVETSERMHIEIALPFFLSARTAAELGYYVLLSGQGPDELFGGYAKHIRLLKEKGESEVNQHLMQEIEVTHDNNLERDEKATAYHKTRLYFPYLNPEFVEYALHIPAKFKLNPNRQISRKIIFRSLAEQMGLHKSISERPKKATQYSSGTSKIFDNALSAASLEIQNASRKKRIELIQNVLNLIAIELGFPVQSPTDRKVNFDREPLDSLLEKIKGE